MKNDTALLPFTFILLGFVAYCGLIIFCSGQVMPEEAFIILLGGVMSCSYLFDKARAKFDINRKNSKDKIIESARESSTKTVEGIIPTNRITSKYLYILISLFGLSIVFIILYFNDIACHFYGVTKDANGQLLTVLLTCIGGCGAIYGLYLNSKRIKEQTRQNDIARIQAGTAKKQADIATNSNNDKRFGDAVGYLGSDNTSIVLGGIHILHQLAKEDERYVPIVANMYTSYLKDRSGEFYSDAKNTNKPPIVIQTIIDILFFKNSVFKNERIDLSYTNLMCIQFNAPVVNCVFYNTNLHSCTFNFGLEGCEFLEAVIFKGLFKKGVSNCIFESVTISKAYFVNEGFVLNDCIFRNANLVDVSFKGKKICDSEFCLDKSDRCRFRVNKIIDSSFELSNTKSIKFNRTELIDSTIDDNNGVSYDEYCRGFEYYNYAPSGDTPCK